MLRILLFVFAVHQVECEFFTSLSDLENLLYTEEELINIMTNYISAEEIRLRKLKGLLNEFATKHNIATVDGKSYVANPINSYLLVKRLSTDWKQIQSIFTDNENNDIIANVSYNRADLKFPDVEDLHGAAIALIRLQDTYKLAVSELARGRIDGAKQSLTLTASDCFELGRQSYAINDYKHTVEWMTQALMKYDSEDSKTAKNSDILEYLAFSTFRMGNVRKALELTRELQIEDPDHPRAPGNIAHYLGLLNKTKKRKKGDDGSNESVQVDDVENNDDEDAEDEVNDYNLLPERDGYEKLCRGEKFMSVTEESKLKCYIYKCGHPYCLLVRFKTEEAHLDPLVVRYHNVLSDNEIEVIKTLATPKLKRATVQHHETGELITASYRISKSAWLSGSEHKVVERVNQKVEMLSGLTMSTAEELQVANYGLGGHYEPHYDFAREDEIKAFDSLGAGNRIATMLFYMSDVEAGGSTVFTKLGVFVRPMKGSGIFWHNLFKSGVGDLRTRHAACPVLAGNKWADDCLEVGYYCYNSYMLNESISWMINGMMKAKIKGEEGRFNFTETFVHIARALYLSGNVNDSYGLAHQISKGTPLEKAEYTDYEEYFNTTKMRESTNYYRNVVEQSENDSENILNLKLCREEDVQNKKVRSKLRCYMKKCLHHPYCNLVRYKLEEISKDPFIVRYYDLITDDEILGVIKNSTSMITRALLFDSDNKPVISDERITKSGWLFPNGDANMMRIDSRLEMATGMDLRSSEPLQVANYGLGGYYSKHADFFLESQLEDWKAIGNRLATALYYLSNVEKGGSTTFPELKLYAKPIKGSVVFWYNLHRNGMGDMRTFHSACPVLLGNKWVANRWIHERRQDVTRPCSLNKDE